MNFESPTDLSPLSYGTGLAMGLALLIGLPAAPRTPAPGRAHVPPAADALSPGLSQAGYDQAEAERARVAYRRGR